MSNSSVSPLSAPLSLMPLPMPADQWTATLARYELLLRIRQERARMRATRIDGEARRLAAIVRDLERAAANVGAHNIPQL